MKFKPVRNVDLIRSEKAKAPDLRQSFVQGTTQSGAGPVPIVSTSLEARDHLGAVAVRLGIHRDHYLVDPGLYALGHPDRESPVIVSANYKLSFDCLRKELGALDAWLLVLDTKGVNVWCSAGKGSFGNAELATRIKLTRLGLVIAGRDLILPQLSATGVDAPSIKRDTGWTVHFGPVLARDLPAYIKAGKIKTEAMRCMDFPFVERIKLIPLELTHALPRFGLLLLLFLAAALASSLFKGVPTSVQAWATIGTEALLAGGEAWIEAFAALLVGTALVPALLPWIPFQAFSLKGLFSGFLLSLIWSIVIKAGPLEAIALFLALPAISAWMALNFTGCSTYTSLAGVKAEIARARIPLIVSMALGLGLRTMLLIMPGI